MKMPYNTARKNCSLSIQPEIYRYTGIYDKGKGVYY